MREIEPAIWRVIQVPSEYSFWDLHVAIQDAMGWLDYHLHAFRVKMPRKRSETEIGIPDEDFDNRDVLTEWKVPIMKYFKEPGKTAIYDYDFGDGWFHSVLLEGILLKEKGLKYLRCIAGDRACPPEDCGGVDGYYQLLKILSDPNHPEHQGHNEWLKGHAKNYFPYEPDKFESEKVEFWDPKKRFKIPFSQGLSMPGSVVSVDAEKIGPIEPFVQRGAGRRKRGTL